MFHSNSYKTYNLLPKLPLKNIFKIHTKLGLNNKINQMEGKNRPTCLRKRSIGSGFASTFYAAFPS